MAITAIVFDLGNVVLTNDWHYDCPEKFQEYSDSFGITYEDMERGWQASMPKFWVGKITEEEFWRIFLEAAGAKEIDVGFAKKLWKKYQKPIENMFGLLAKLKKSYRLAALTNIPKEFLDYKREKYFLDSYFKIIVSSGYSGLMKPDPRIYKMLVKKLKAKPEECLLVDDYQENLKPAKELGMKTVLFSGQPDLEKELKGLGIKF